MQIFQKAVSVFRQTVTKRSNVSFSVTDFSRLKETMNSPQSFFWRHNYVVLDGRQRVRCEVAFQTDLNIDKYDSTVHYKNKTDRFVFSFRVAFKGLNDDKYSPCMHRNWSR